MDPTCWPAPATDKNPSGNSVYGVLCKLVDCVNYIKCVKRIETCKTSNKNRLDIDRNIVALASN